MDSQLVESFGQEMSSQCQQSFYMVNFLRPDIFDEEGVLVQDAPKMYEPGGK
jgi:dynein heavy chain